MDTHVEALKKANKPWTGDDKYNDCIEHLNRFDAASIDRLETYDFFEDKKRNICNKYCYNDVLSF